jgi:hypothetical protein
MASIQSRLQWVMKHGRLTTADLQKWFDRSYPSVRNWIEFGVCPRGPRTEKLLSELAILERLIKKRKGLPVPWNIGHHERPIYIRKLRNENDNRLLRSDTTR